MANEENLIKFTSDQSREAAKRNGRKGGIASGEAKRKRRKMKDWLNLIGNTPIAMTLPDKTAIDGDMNAAVVMKMYNKAITGDVKAAKFLADLGGEMVHQMEVKDVTPQVVVKNEKTAEKLRQLMEGKDEDADA